MKRDLRVHCTLCMFDVCLKCAEYKFGKFYEVDDAIDLDIKTNLTFDTFHIIMITMHIDRHPTKWNDER